MLSLVLTLAIVTPDVSEPLRDRQADEPPSSLPPDGAAPLDAPVREAGVVHPEKPIVARPYGSGARPPPPPDPRKQWIARIDVMTGPQFRKPAVDTLVATSLEYGRSHGFAGIFHTGILVGGPAIRGREFFGVDPDIPTALDFPIGVGALARARMKRRPVFASIGLTFGMLIHRAKTERGIVRRVDPDFRVPIRFAWTIAKLGMSLAFEHGYSVRSRSYSRQGAEVWSRPAYRVGFLIGLHWDVAVPAVRGGTGSRRRGR